MSSLYDCMIEALENNTYSKLPIFKDGDMYYGYPYYGFDTTKKIKASPYKNSTMANTVYKTHYDLVKEKESDSAVLVVYFTVPGVDTESLDLSILRDTLTLKYALKEDADKIYCKKDNEQLKHELNFNIPINTYNYELMESSYSDGIVSVRIPKLKEVKIPIKIQQSY